jgi:hypothetical protein
MKKVPEYALPIREDESESDFISIRGQAVIDYGLAMRKLVDASQPYSPVSTKDAPKYIANTINAKYVARAKTVADKLAEKPELLAVMREMGLL